VLPPRVVAGYWHSWGTPSVRLRDVPKEYTVVMAAFAVGDRTGRVRFTPTVQSAASLAADIRSLHASGRRVLLAVGGWNDGGLQIRTEAQLATFLASVTPIIDRYGFSGLDWDLEHGISPATLERATRRLTERYGQGFAITMAPILGEREPEQLELARRIADELDMVNPQYYNGGRSEPAWIVEHTLGWARVVGEQAVGMGFLLVRLPGETGTQTPQAICGMWQSLLKRLPRARGVMVWSVNHDRSQGYRFAKTCARTVLRS
jgi:chitinase